MAEWLEKITLGTLVGLLLDSRAVTETSSDHQLGRIFVVGIGNDGRNRVHRMLSHHVSDVSFIVVDADPRPVDTLGHDVAIFKVGLAICAGRKTNEIISHMIIPLLDDTHS